MRNDGGGFGGYVWSGLTGILTVLTPQDVIFALGAVVTAILGILTYLSNDRRNKRIAAAEEARNEILKRYLPHGDGPDAQLSSADIRAIQEID